MCLLCVYNFVGCFFAIFSQGVLLLTGFLELTINFYLSFYLRIAIQDELNALRKELADTEQVAKDAADQSDALKAKVLELQLRTPTNENLLSKAETSTELTVCLQHAAFGFLFQLTCDAFLMLSNKAQVFFWES